MLEQYAFAVKRGQLSDEEKLFWSRRVLSDTEYQELFNNDDYDLVEAELDYNEQNRFVGRMEMYDLDSAEYSVVALAAMRMNDDDSIPAVIHSPVVSMTISEGGTIPLYSQPTGYVDGYGYVDLGLPSGTLWAYTNIGANTPEDYGNYYAWGETEAKETYEWETYLYCNGDSEALTKYCNDESYGLDGYTDSLTTLEAVDDAASVNWGGNWRMPTQDEMQELIDNCDTTWTTQNGINGMLYTSRTNGNSIFLPAAGNRVGSELYNIGSFGGYWTSSLYYSSGRAWYLGFPLDWYGMYGDYRYYGRSVRPVCVQSKKKWK